jgi:hypothetical protein
LLQSLQTNLHVSQGILIVFLRSDSARREEESQGNDSNLSEHHHGGRLVGLSAY